MINFEKDIYLQETEIRPNRYASIAILATLVVISLSWAMNELGLFHVDRTTMRVGACLAILGMLPPFVYRLIKKDALADPRYKYLIMFAAVSFTLATSILITFHTTIMLIFPMFLAMLYRSRALGNFAMIASLFCASFSALIGYLLGVWDVPLFQELIAIATNGTVTIEGAYAGLSFESAVKIMMYLAFPKILMIGACAILMHYVIKLGHDHVEAQIELQRKSHVDVLTGLYNSNYYKQIIEGDRDNIDVGVVFFDVNDLKLSNDKYGHEYGDMLLQRSALSILDACTKDSISAFRIGGDEFLVIYENCVESDLNNFLRDWNEALTRINEENKTEFNGLHCSLACGSAMGSFSNIKELISKADAQMYMNKELMKSAQQSLLNR